MKINKLLLSAITIPCIGITSALTISCGGRNEVNIKMPLNSYVEDKSLSIFNVSKWENKSIKDINLDFIKSTIIRNDKYTVEISENENDIFKNEDLNYVSFLYRYGRRDDSSNTATTTTNWFVQTVHFDNANNVEEEISLEEYWKLAEEKGESSSTNGGSLYKYSFDSSTADYSSTYPVPGIYHNMTQKIGHFFTLPSYIAEQNFLDEYGHQKITHRFQGNESYTKDKDYFYQDFIRVFGQNKDIATTTFLTKDVKIKRIDRGNNKYIKFEIPAGSIKITIDNKDYFNDFNDSLYINITNWFK